MQVDSEGELDPIRQYANYPFSTDDEYQQGLASVVASGALDSTTDDIVREDMIRRTRVFYFNRVTGASITIEQARELELRDSPQAAKHFASAAAQSNSTISSDEPVVLTFAEIKALIESGKEDQIPNNKLIPDILNDAPPSMNNSAPRKKPWEQAETA